MSKEKESFVFHTDVYRTENNESKSFEINDQNVVEFEFINLSNSIITINNSIVLETRDSQFYRWKETINENEKTQTIYKVIINRPTVVGKKDYGLIVIQKLPAKPRR